jgi:hypothetical protein
LDNLLRVCGMHHIFWHLFGHVDPYTTGPFPPIPTLNSVLTSLHSMLCCCVNWCQTTICGNRQMFGLHNFCYLLIIFLSFYIILNFFERPSEMMNLVAIMPNKSIRPSFNKILTNFREIAMLGEMNEMGFISFWWIQKKMIFWSIANCANFPCH